MLVFEAGDFALAAEFAGGGGHPVSIVDLASGNAERAVHLAARLRRHARRGAALSGDVHRLDNEVASAVDQVLCSQSEIVVKQDFNRLWGI